MLNYVDRQILSVLKPALKGEFGFDDQGYGNLVNVFTIAYAAMYPVAGWLVDRFGARSTMAAALLTWSLACVGAGFSRAYGSLLVFRGLLGVAEPVAFPAQLRAVTTCYPERLRATANSISVAGGTIGAAIAPPLVAWMAVSWNWRVAFIVPGCIGLGFAAWWWGAYREVPVAEDTPEQVAAKRAFSWRELWTTRTLWGLLLIRLLCDPVWYFCLFWLPGYLQENVGLSLTQTGLVGWVPFLIADVGAIASAVWSDRWVGKGMAPLRARKRMLTAMALLAPACALTPYATHPFALLLIFSAVATACLSWLFNLSVVIAETFPTGNGASVLGIAGGCGALGAVAFNAWVGPMMSHWGSGWVFGGMALLYPLASVVLWTMTRRERPQSLCT